VTDLETLRYPVGRFARATVPLARDERDAHIATLDAAPARFRGLVAGLSDAQLRLLALEGVVRLIARIADESTGALVLLDDVHAADADSIEAMRYLAGAGPPRVLLVAALRSHESHRNTPYHRSGKWCAPLPPR